MGVCMKPLSLQLFLRLSCCFYGMLVAFSIQAMEQSNVNVTKKTTAAGIIENALRGYGTYKKTMKQLHLGATTAFREERLLCDGYDYYDCYLYNKESFEQYGRIQYCLPNNITELELCSIETKPDFRRLGVGTFLFNHMLKHIYAINKNMVEQGKKPYTKITWKACPLDGQWWNGGREKLLRLIDFYKSLNAKVEWCGDFSAGMYIDLYNVDAVKKITAAGIIKNALRGQAIRKKSDQQLILSKTTTIEIFKVEEEGVALYECSLWSKDHTIKYGDITFSVPEHSTQAELNILHVEEVCRRSGVGTYLFNYMLRCIYACNKVRIEEGQKPFTEIVWLARPYGGRPGKKMLSQGKLERVISFYESVDAEVVSIEEGYGAYMCIKLRNF